MYERVKRVSAVNIKTLAEAHHHNIHNTYDRNTLPINDIYYVWVLGGYWVSIGVQIWNSNVELGSWQLPQYVPAKTTRDVCGVWEEKKYTFSKSVIVGRRHITSRMTLYCTIIIPQRVLYYNIYSSIYHKQNRNNRLS